MWYDLLVLAILGYFLLRGAARGLLTQLASIAAIVICLAFAESISAAFGPYVSLEPPLNHWVVMFGAYLVCSFITFGLARVLTDWMEQARLESFNQHLGAIFGLLKGIAVSLVLTFFLTTLSPASRSALSDSKAAYAAAWIMHRIHPIMPEQINEALTTYLRLYEAEGAGEESAGPSLVDAPSPPHPTTPPGGGGSSPAAPTATSVEQFLAQLPASLGEDLRWLIGRALQNTPPEQRPQAQQQLWNLVRQAQPEDLADLKQQLLASSRQTLAEAMDAWARSFVTPTSRTPTAAPAGGSASPSPAPSSSPVLLSRQEELLVEISRAFSSIPPVQVQVQADIRRRLTGLPEEVVLAVLEDWRRDLRSPRESDPDPGTDATTPLEARIVRQLQFRRIPVQQLSREVQERLEGAMLR
jgi:membrane protein required for colicin V production